ncbi:Transcriptional activator protein LasR [compost metagenome]
MHIASSTQFQSTTPRGAPHNCADTSPISPQLSTEELEILKWCAMGKSSWEIAQTLARSEAGVNYHIDNILRKFGVSSRTKKIPMHWHRDFLYRHSQQHRETTISSEEEYPVPDSE